LGGPGRGGGEGPPPRRPLVWGPPPPPSSGLCCRCCPCCLYDTAPWYFTLFTLYLERWEGAHNLRKQKYCSSLELSLLLRSERFPRRTQGTTSVTMKEAVRPVGQPVRRCRVGLCLVWSALPERKVNNSRWRSPPRAPGLALAAAPGRRRFASIRDAREFLEFWTCVVTVGVPRCTYGVLFY